MTQFIKKHWSTIIKVHKRLIHTVRASLLLYVAWFAMQQSFYAWAIAFIYFAFVDYYYNFNLVKQ